jgi:copper chaperone CopZ
MQKLRTDRFAAVAGFLVLSAAVIAYACTTKSASLVGRVSTAAAPAAAAVVPAGGTAPAGSACQSGETCYFFEIMSATDADGKAIADLTGKTMKAKCAKNVAMPANWTNEMILVANADLDWDKQMIQIAKMETAPEAVAVAAKANWEKYAVATAGTMAAGGKAGCCAAGAAAASAKGASCTAKTDAAAASAKGASCTAKTDAATASSGAGCCAGKASAATASSGKGSCSGSDAAAAGGKASCHGKSEASAASARALVLNVSGMTCGGCVSKVEKALMSVKGVASAKVDLEAHNAKVDVAKEVKAEDLVKAIEAAGFKAEVAAVPAEAPAKG